MSSAEHSFSLMSQLDEKREGFQPVLSWKYDIHQVLHDPTECHPIPLSRGSDFTGRLGMAPDVRHRECADIASLTRKVPDLGEIRDPSAFIQLMRNKGYQETVNKVTTSTRKVVEINAPEQEPFLLFVTPEVCHQSERG